MWGGGIGQASVAELVHAFSLYIGVLSFKDSLKSKQFGGVWVFNLFLEGALEVGNLRGSLNGNISTSCEHLGKSHDETMKNILGLGVCLSP